MGGGHVSDPLTALKFGALALATGADEEEGDDVLEQVLNTSQYWQTYFNPSATCTPCGTVLASSTICEPGNATAPPLKLHAFEGTYGNGFYGDVLSLSAGESGITARFGPINSLMDFGPNNTVVQGSCAIVASKIASLSPPRVEAASILSEISHQEGTCVMVE